MLSESWNENEGKVCAGLNWDIFTDVKQAKVKKLLSLLSVFST